jgi:hypothetical protein
VEFAWGCRNVGSSDVVEFRTWCFRNKSIELYPCTDGMFSVSCFYFFHCPMLQLNVYANNFSYPFHSLSQDSSQPLTKRVLYTVRSDSSSFDFQYPLVFLQSLSRCFRLLPCLPFTSIHPPIFPSITCFKRHFLHKM